MGLRSLVRNILVGRPGGVRAGIRRRTGVLSWIDEPGSIPFLEEAGEPTDRQQPASAAPAGPVVPQPVVPDSPAPRRDGWTAVIDLAEVPPGTVAEVFVGDRALAVVNADGEIYAVDSTCPHAGGPLADGQLEGCMLTCPLHGWSFDVRDGTTPVSVQVRLLTVPVRVEAGTVLVEV